MTIRLSLDSTAESGPSRFGTPSSDTEQGLSDVVRALRSAKRLVVVCGAGVSTAANIPDFRSSTGLFAPTSAGPSTPSRKGKESVKDLFHVKALSSPRSLAAHHELINRLAELAAAADATPFHSFLSTHDADGRLLRVYTQNIDNLEEKAGLSFGIPTTLPSTPRRTKSPSSTPRPTTADAPLPRVIPLHGSLTHLHCPLCHHSTPLAPHLPLPPTSLPCPSCSFDSSIRSALSERQRKIGSLRASIVLYGEEHPKGDIISKIVSKDTSRSGADMLLVAGTSLSIPGVKRMIKDFSSTLASAKSGIKRPKTIFVNDEPPRNASEWEGIFDVWVQGDVQAFVVDYLANPNFAATLSKRPLTPRKRKEKERSYLPPTPESLDVSSSKRKHGDSSDFTTPTKRRAVGADSLLTPGATPSSARSENRSRLPSPVPFAFPATTVAGRFEGSLTPLSDDESPLSRLGRA